MSRPNPQHTDTRVGGPWSRRAVLSLAVALVGAQSAWPQAAQAQAQAKAETSAKTLRLVAFGDSLSAGYQLPPAAAFPAQLETALRARGHDVRVQNAGVSGDTTAAGLDRLAWAVPADTEGVIVEFGANDALRGLDPAKARSNLDQILATLSAQKMDLLVAGMLAPTSLPPSYRTVFDGLFPELAKKHGALLYPFFLERTALQPKLNLADGLHPNAAGVAEIVAGILPTVENLIARIKSRRAAKM
jgi:acyl-CoA thioesterase I